jgi:hypothetical protein
MFSSGSVSWNLWAHRTTDAVMIQYRTGRCPTRNDQCGFFLGSAPGHPMPPFPPTLPGGRIPLNENSDIILSNARR